MHLNMVGIDYRTAPVATREKVSIRPEKLGDALSDLSRFVPHGVILSTCNRTEIYWTGDSPSSEPVNDFFLSFFRVAPDDLRQCIIAGADEIAVSHLFRTAAGLDSLIVGEYEVLGQVGRALDAAEQAGMVDLPLRQLFQWAIRTGRRVREETFISRNAMSVSSVAVELAAGTIGGLEDCKVLVIGAGEAGRLVAKTARDRGAAKIAVTSRTKERAQKLAEELGGEPFCMEKLAGEMTSANIVIACADAPHWVLTANQVSDVMERRPGQPLVIIDIAVPRNVDPRVAQIPNVFLYNIDELATVAEENRQQRAGEIEKAEKIVAFETERFMAWWQTVGYRPVLSALMGRAEAIRSAHLDRTLRKLRPLSDEEKERLESMTRAIVNKILHDPLEWLKANGNGRGDNLAVVREMFRLPGDDAK